MPRPSESKRQGMADAEAELIAAALAVADWCRSCNHDADTCDRHARLVLAAVCWRAAKGVAGGPAR